MTDLFTATYIKFIRSQLALNISYGDIVDNFVKRYPNRSRKITRPKIRYKVCALNRADGMKQLKEKYVTVGSILQKERDTGKLTPIPPDIFEREIKKISEIMIRVCALDDALSDEATSLIDDVALIREPLTDLFSIRSRKILAIAIMHIENKCYDHSEVDLMLHAEQDVFHCIVDALGECRGILFGEPPLARVVDAKKQIPDTPTIIPDISKIPPPIMELIDKMDNFRQAILDVVATGYTIKEPDKIPLCENVVDLSMDDLKSEIEILKNTLATVKDNKMTDEQKTIIDLLEKRCPKHVCQSDLKQYLHMKEAAFRRAIYGAGGTVTYPAWDSLFIKEPRLKTIINSNFNQRFFYLEPKKEGRFEIDKKQTSVKPVKYPPIKLS